MPPASARARRHGSGSADLAARRHGARAADLARRDGRSLGHLRTKEDLEGDSLVHFNLWEVKVAFPGKQRRRWQILFTPFRPEINTCKTSKGAFGTL